MVRQLCQNQSRQALRQRGEKTAREVGKELTHAFRETQSLVNCYKLLADNKMAKTILASAAVLINILIFLKFSSQQECNVDDAKRVDCGWHGIDNNTCTNTNKCCWRKSSAAGFPWCFYDENLSKILKSAVTCEHRTPITLVCNTTERISIHDVFYGRNGDDNSCHNDGTVTCFNPNATNIVKGICKSNSTCQVSPKGNFWNFETGCDNLNAQLKIHYICVGKDSSTVVLPSTSVAVQTISYLSIQPSRTQSISSFDTTVLSSTLLSSYIETISSVLEKTDDVSTDIMSSTEQMSNTADNTKTVVDHSLVSTWTTASTTAAALSMSSTEAGGTTSKPTAATAMKTSTSTATEIFLNTSVSVILSPTVTGSAVTPDKTSTRVVVTSTHAPIMNSSYSLQTSSSSPITTPTITPTSITTSTTFTTSPSRTSSTTTKKSTLILVTTTESSSNAVRSTSFTPLTTVVTTPLSSTRAEMVSTTSKEHSSMTSTHASPTPSSSSAVSSSVKTTNPPDGTSAKKRNERILYAVGGGAVLFVIIIVIVVYCIKKNKRGAYRHEMLTDLVSYNPRSTEIKMDDVSRVKHVGTRKLNDYDNPAIELVDENGPESYLNAMYGIPTQQIEDTKR